jgi:hypothetical protein
VGKKYLKGFLTYINKVYKMDEKIKRVPEVRKKPQTSIQTIVYVIFLGLLFRMDSMNHLNGWIKTNRFKKMLPRGSRIPLMDTLRRVLKKFNVGYLHEINVSIIQKSRRNGVLRRNGINGYTVVAIDGVELFKSKNTSCKDCLTRMRTNEEMEYFHKGVVCMSVGSAPRVILGLEMLHPRYDGSDKDEGEQTGAKRLVKKLYTQFHHFADVVVADALYLNSPFISMVHSLGIDVVIRMKDERFEIMKDAMELFQKQDPEYIWTTTKGSTITQIQSWKATGMYWRHLKIPLCIYLFKEKISNPNGNEFIKDVWVVTTMDQEKHHEIIWEIMHKRWDVENCGFHQLKTQCGIDHCFIHDATAIESILMLTVIAFNLLQLYIHCRLHRFLDKKITTKLFVESMLFQAVSGEGFVRMLDPP